MPTLSIELPANDPDYRGHVLYAVHFCDERISGFSLNDAVLSVTFNDPGAAAEIEPKLHKLAQRYAKYRAAFERRVLWSTGNGAVPGGDPYPDLVARSLAVVEGQGRVCLRGLAADLAEFLDNVWVRRVAAPMGCRRETYPVTIGGSALAAVGSMTSFPQHLQFVFHLREDIDLVDDFTNCVRKAGDFDAGVARRALDHGALPKVILNSSVCYHCYLGLGGSDVALSGHAVTARSRCHRYEAGNLASLKRLADFDMREVIFVGRAPWVLEMRGRVDELMRGIVSEWQMAASFVTASDPFFTDDYEVKATFQRKQDLKRELIVALPGGGEMAIGSSNYHASNMATAFNVKAGKRPACSACFGWGLERWVYAIFIQFGLDPARWPQRLRSDFEDWRTSAGLARFDGR